MNHGDTETRREAGGGRVLFTIGHSNQTAERFLELLQAHRIEVLVDVRSAPYSRYAPQFNQEALRRAVSAAGIRYVFSGRELGGRPDGAAFYDRDGRVDYGRLSRSPLFLQGIAQLEQALPGPRMTLMCSEENPAECHRHLLIARVLAERGIEVVNIRGDGGQETYAAVEESRNPPDPQLALFDEPKESEWKSIRSVLPGRAPESSSEP